LETQSVDAGGVHNPRFIRKTGYVEDEHPRTYGRIKSFYGGKIIAST
jgi:hypothetical protein